MRPHSRSRPSFVPYPAGEVDPRQVRLAVATLAIAIVLVGAVVAIVVRFL